MLRCFRDHMFIHFGTIPACDGRTDKRTDRYMATAYPALVKHHTGKLSSNIALYKSL